MAAIANAAYTRGDGAGGLGLANFRHTGQSIGHSNLHANLPFARSTVPRRQQSCTGSTTRNPANKLADPPWRALNPAHPHRTAPNLGVATS